MNADFYYLRSHLRASFFFCRHLVAVNLKKRNRYSSLIIHCSSLLLIFLSVQSSLCAERGDLSEEMLYKRLDPLSISEQLSFYHLYPESHYGKGALKKAWELLQGQPLPTAVHGLSLPSFDLEKIISLITRQSIDPSEKLSEEQLFLVEELGKSLANRKLLGSRVWNKETFDTLPVSEIDLGRGLLINQFNGAENSKDSTRQYEALLDIMALQIRARLPKSASHLEKIQAINAFIFHEMNYRFPPHSLYSKNVDLYTFLPSVLDSRQGVCLGVSVLYLCLAQRLDLPLEIITPPGHIYIRYNDRENIVNIETTARGINTPSETYLGVNTRKLPKRSIREVLGMVFYNHASIAWETHEFSKANTLYEKALVYMPDDLQLKMLLGFTYLLSGRKSEGKDLLEKEAPFLFDEAVSAETIAEDYLNGNVTLKGLKAVFTHVDNKKESILKKQKKIEKVLETSPLFREGWFQLATTYLQLRREGEAFDILKKYNTLDPHNATASYYLSILALERMDYNEAWVYLNQAESVCQARNHRPKALQGLRQHLKRLCPEH